MKTDSKKIAARLAEKENSRLDQYWANLIETGEKHAHGKYKQLVERARLLGFVYQHVDTLATGDYPELFKRLVHVEKHSYQEVHVEAVIGTETEPQIMLAEVFPIYVALNRSIEIDKSASQYRKWKNPRKLAMANVISCLGNKALNELSKDGINQLKDWYLSRIEREEITFGTADKHFVQIKSMITSVCKDRKITIDKSHLFDEFYFNKDDSKPRPPFSTNYIVDVLLNPDKLKGLSRAHRGLLKVFAETGVHVKEIVGVQPEDIHLDGPIPHFFVKNKPKNKLKTKHRERVMPLTGYALEAFKEFPGGFSQLINNVDSATSVIGNYLRENDMLETPDHSTYSLRHSFQDRLTNKDCPDRIQTDLMGHAFKDRTKYGMGATLQNAYKWMRKIQLNKNCRAGKINFQ